MHCLEIIKHRNETNDESGQLPHTEAGFNSADNVGGIQGHSQGPVFPVVEFQVGDHRLLSQAPFALGCVLEATSYRGQRSNSHRLKRLEALADEICQGVQTGLSQYKSFRKSKVDLGSGYLVNIVTVDEIVRVSDYAGVYKFLFDNRQHLSDGGVVGARLHHGKTCLFLLKWFTPERLVDAAELARQLGGGKIWDCANKVTLFA